jgi:hypothetical protein
MRARRAVGPRCSTTLGVTQGHHTKQTAATTWDLRLPVPCVALLDGLDWQIEGVSNWASRLEQARCGGVDILKAPVESVTAYATPAVHHRLPYWLQPHRLHLPTLARRVADGLAARQGMS